MKYKVGDEVIFNSPLRGVVSDDGFIVKEVFIKNDVRRITDTDDKYYFVDNFGSTIKVKHEVLEYVADIYVGGDANEITNNGMIEGLVEDVQEETIKLYTWQDLCDYEILLHEKWRIVNEQRKEQGQELSVIHTLRQEYMEAIKRAMDKLGREVPASKAKELGFEV